MMQVIERVPTGIKGLDEALYGGFIKNNVNLVVGGPGSGKSIFAMQYILNGILQHNEPGVYITLEERKDRFMKSMSPFGWNLEKLEGKNMLSIVNLSPIDIEVSPLDTEKSTHAKGLGLKYSIVKKMKARRIVIDSVTAYALLYPDELSRRRSYLQLFESLRDWECTALLVAEHDAEEQGSTPLDFEVDSIIKLYNFKKTEIRTRGIEIYKMRGSNHSKKTFALEIGDRGIEVYPKKQIY